MDLLTVHNMKTAKSVSKGYLTGVLHLSPYTLAGVGNMCPKASKGCISGCLNKAGHGGMTKPNGENKVQEARIRRTIYFKENTSDFMLELYVDIIKLARTAKEQGLKPCIRLNGTSDIIWESIPVNGHKNIFEALPHIQFYDYTKILNRKASKIANYHLTFSKSEVNDKEVDKALAKGMNVAVVFKSVPTEYKGYKVVDGDETDLRFLDEPNSVIGLKAKGPARKDASGFVVQ